MTDGHFVVGSFGHHSHKFRSRSGAIFLGCREKNLRHFLLVDMKGTNKTYMMLPASFPALYIPPFRPHGPSTLSRYS